MSDQFKSGLGELSKERSLYPQESLLKARSKKNSLQIGIPKETAFQENRVALTPDSVALLVNNGHEVIVEHKAGKKSKFEDSEYAEAGAKIGFANSEIFQSDIVLKIEPPTHEEIELIKKGAVLISALQIGNQKVEYLNALMEKKITAIGFELLEDKAGGMPIVRAMSEISGNVALPIASEYLNSFNEGNGIIIGGVTGVPPTKIVILGAGTVAEYAARAALGLGAEVQVFSNHIYKLRRIRQMLGQQIYTASLDTVTLTESLKSADVVIGAIRAEKGRTKVVVSEEMVMAMKPNSVIIDVSIDQGGIFATSEITTHDKPVFRKHDVIHYCVPNIASRVARTATTAFSNIFTPILLRVADEGDINDMIFNHKWFMRGVYIYRGSLTNYMVAQKFNLKCKDLNLLLAARY